MDSNESGNGRRRFVVYKAQSLLQLKKGISQSLSAMDDPVRVPHISIPKTVQTASDRPRPDLGSGVDRDHQETVRLSHNG